MNENNNNIKNDNCLNSISFTLIGAFIITFESISLAMSVLCLAMTSWNFLKIFIKILNIISLIIIFLALIINVLIFIKIKNERIDIIQNIQMRMCLSFILLLLYLIIMIFNIFNAIYLTIRLHIADYPEYGGRKRDQNYIDEHPDEFGNVSLKEFIIVGFCPSIISVLNLICIILCVIFRKKMILIYDKMISEDENKLHEINEMILHRNKSKHNKRTKNRNKNNRITRRYSSEIRNANTNDKIIKNNNTVPNIEINNKEFNNDNNNFIDIKINKTNDDDIYTKNIPNKYPLNNRLETKETLNEEQKEDKNKESILTLFNSADDGKSNMNSKDE